ncbi:CBS and cyclic nucleotide-binding domain-containing protein [Naegleria gruberi]|uniref:CBS and cyclic nucleotide-binding domain-containing protein n=1 Tax=Naegleria gruberi TaxID=5762 RepID=D2VQE7_NAEGR|nr:CBS and cyclic nucleotide-binding domain-containing protein [Naegleria gruberi]EFC40934.1 CBS and cyclic nucleotide-binding domain-containing protein [Naegleria gruberi]|eukprot:XP_002673678.1 CBS and cyclic nucleotide-binding domain-containing protein [Naegleria gruberi strain NEG-M]
MLSVNDNRKAPQIKKKSFSLVFTLSLLILVALATLSFENYVQHDESVAAWSDSSSMFVEGYVPTTKRFSNVFASSIDDNSTIDWPTVCAHYYNHTNGSSHTGEEKDDEESILNMPWYDIVINVCASIFFILGAGLMSGFTLGLLSIDTMQLDILKSTGTEKERKYAARLAPILKRHHLLLVTLLLWNALCVECLPLFLDKLVPEWVAILLGITAVLLFGEIIPQAVISRYGIAIGGTLFWLVWFLIGLAFIISYPISKLLDWILGADHGTLYKRTELKELVNIHSKAHDPNFHLTEHEAKILGGALEFARIPVSQIMTKFENVYMLDIDNKLDVETMTSIWQAGHSRIPVFKGDKNNIVGLLYVKDLILVNPDECLPISTILTFYGREVLKVFPDTYCDEMLKTFKSGRTHIAIVHEPRESETGGDPYYAIVGIVSLEDIIEEIIKDEIVDETDIYVDNTNQSKINRPQNSTSLLLKLERTHRLTPKQVVAVASYLWKSMATFRLLPEEYLHRLLGKCAVVDIKKTSDQELLLIEKNKECDFFALVFSGKLEAVFGEEKFTSEMGPWSFIGERALTRETFIPDYDVRIVKDVSFVKITKKDFIEIISQVFIQEDSFFLPKDMEWMNPILTNMTKNQTSNVKISSSPHIPHRSSDNLNKNLEPVRPVLDTTPADTEIELDVDHTISQKKGFFQKYSKFKDDMNEEDDIV